MGKRSGSSFPRVNCLVPGCKRGTTRCAPNPDGSAPEIICGKHWRTVPTTWRRRQSLYLRRFRAAERKEDDRHMQVAARCWWSGWERIKRLLINPESMMAEGLPATMATELNREGLI